MFDAERWAHAADKFNEVVMRRDGAQAGEDLESMVVEIDDWHRYATDSAVDRDARGTATLNLGGVMLDYWLTIRAALKRLSQREDVIARLDREVEGHIELVVETQRSRDAVLARERELREALGRIEGLAEAGMPAATQWMHDASDLIRIREVARKALLAQPAAGEERERG